MIAITVLAVALILILAGISLAQGARDARESGEPVGHAVRRRAGGLLAAFAMAVPELVIFLAVLAVVAVWHALA